MDVARDQHPAVALARAHWAVFPLFPTSFQARSPGGAELGGGQAQGQVLACACLLPADSMSKHSKQAASPTPLSLGGGGGGRGFCTYVSICIALGKCWGADSDSPSTTLLEVRAVKPAQVCGMVCERHFCAVLLHPSVCRHVCRPGYTTVPGPERSVAL